jgi:hypothetical protein
MTTNTQKSAEYLISPNVDLSSVLELNPVHEIFLFLSQLPMKRQNFLSAKATDKKC